jgi:hypothetical protein
MTVTWKPELKPEFRYWETSMQARKFRTQAEQDAFWRFHWPDLPMEGPAEPQCGYYKMRRMVGTTERWVPVGIWIAEGVMQAAAGGPVTHIPSVWARCSRNPISYEDYNYAVENGKFRGEVEAQLPKLNNYADDPHADYREQMVSLLAQVEAFLKGLPDPVTEEGAHALANYTALINQSQKTAKTLLDAEIAGKKAEIKQQKDIWDIPLKAAVDISGRIKKLMTPFLVAKKNAGEETRIGGQGTGNGRARRVGLRSQWKAKIVDWDLAMQSYSGHPQVRELVQTLANAAARSKELRAEAMDGIEFYSEDVAA